MKQTQIMNIKENKSTKQQTYINKRNNKQTIQTNIHTQNEKTTHTSYTTQQTKRPKDKITKSRITNIN